MPAFVKTPADEARWNKAKEVVSKASKKPESEFKDAHWAQVNAIYQKMSGVKKMANGGMVDRTPGDQIDMNKGGVVPSSKKDAEEAIKKQPINMKAGGKVPGKPSIPGKIDSLKNDTVPAKLSPGEVVLPRSVTQSPNASQKAAQFVQQAKAPMHPNPAVAAAMMRLKQSGGVNPRVLAALHMAHPQAAQALAQANNLHPALPSALAQILQNAKSQPGAAPQAQPPIMPPPGVSAAPVAPQSAPGIPPPQNMARGGMVQQHNKAIQSALGAPNMTPAKPAPKMPQPNSMMSPVPNMAKGGMVAPQVKPHSKEDAKASNPHGLKKIVMHYNNGGLVSMPVPQVEPQSNGDAEAAVQRGPDPFYTPASMMPPSQGPSVPTPPAQPNQQFANYAHGGMVSSCYSKGGIVCMAHGGMMTDSGSCMAAGGMVNKPKLGTGERFHDLANKVRSEGYSKESSNAIAASAGRKSHGNAEMNKLSKEGKK